MTKTEQKTWTGREASEHIGITYREFLYLRKGLALTPVQVVGNVKLYDDKDIKRMKEYVALTNLIRSNTRKRVKKGRRK